eukprot:284213-Rhodomonas_salina.1
MALSQNGDHAPSDLGGAMSGLTRPEAGSWPRESGGVRVGCRRFGARERALPEGERQGAGGSERGERGRGSQEGCGEPRCECQCRSVCSGRVASCGMNVSVIV